MRDEIRKIIVSSDPINLQVVENFLKDIDKAYGICSSVYPNILITLTEAVNNAIHHGNNADHNKKIAICCKIKNKGLTFKISDEGHGFNHKTIPDPTSPERIHKENGRGVFIMKQLSDKLTYTDRGSTVEIHFSL